MNSKKKDIVITSLEYARERLLNGKQTDHTAFNNFLVQEKHIDPNQPGKEQLITALYEQIISFKDQQYATPPRFMGLDSYLGLLDYEELQLARQDSARARAEARQAIKHAEEATRLTKKALTWTIVSVILAMIVGLTQIIIPFLAK